MTRKPSGPTLKLFLDIFKMNQANSNCLLLTGQRYQGSHRSHQWHYNGSSDNLTDYISRGIDVANDKAVQKWF